MEEASHTTHFAIVFQSPWRTWNQKQICRATIYLTVCNMLYIIWLYEAYIPSSSAYASSNAVWNEHTVVHSSRLVYLMIGTALECVRCVSHRTSSSVGRLGPTYYYYYCYHEHWSFTFKRTRLTNRSPCFSFRFEHFAVGTWMREEQVYVVSTFLLYEYKIGQTVSSLPLPRRISVYAFVRKFERPIGLFVRFFINISIVRIKRNKIENQK